MEPSGCRDRRRWPFAAHSIWNTAIGSAAIFLPANLYAGDALRPDRFHVDVDYFVSTAASDPPTAFVNQGWWGAHDGRWGGKCGNDHCCLEGKVVGSIPFPERTIIAAPTGNNAAAVLLPDGVTLLQFQPIYRCAAGSPLTGLAGFLHQPWSNVSILSAENASFGAHGGSHLSSIGGTIRRGELLPSAPPIRHALKLMVWAERYYWRGNATDPCFRWPAIHCDNARMQPNSTNFYNGTSDRLKPGALLAVAPKVAAALAPRMATRVGRKLLAALCDYGGYLDDNTASNSGAFNVEDGVAEEVAASYGGLSLDARAGQPLYADLLAIFRQLHIVDNNAADAVGGGGVPRRPPPPPICGVGPGASLSGMVEAADVGMGGTDLGLVE